MFCKDFDFQLKEHGRRPLKCSKNGAWRNCVSDVHVLIYLYRSNAVIHVVSDLYGDNGGRVPSGKLPTAALYEEYPCAFFLRHSQDTSLSAQRGARVG